MKHIVVMVVVLLATMMVVSAAPTQLSEFGCADANSAEYDPSDDSQNCFDIVCAVVANGDVVRVSDGTDDAQNSEPLRGHVSYVTKDESDLRDVSGQCSTPIFREAFCSVRADWSLEVGIMRHYNIHEDADADDEVHRWNDEALEAKPSVAASNSESDVITVDLAYTCADTLAPQLLYTEDFDHRKGERELTLTFSDDEMNYQEMNLSGTEPERTDKVQLLMTPFDEAEDVDATMLEENSCAYAILERGTEPADSDWTDVRCSGYTDSKTITFGSDEYLNGYTLWMRASDDQDNAGNASYDLIDYYPALGEDAVGDPEGYCPQENECLVWPSGAIEPNTFSDYKQGAKVRPACVTPGEAVDNVYCTSDGLVHRSQALLEYGVSQLNTGTVYCGAASEVTRGGEEEPACQRYATSYRPDCALTCVLSEDNDGGTWQRAAALFASNNFMNDGTVHVPDAFRESLLLGDDYEWGSCSTSGETVTCGIEERSAYPNRIGDAALRYHNGTGLGSISQTLPLDAPTDSTIESGHDTFTTGLETLTTRLNAYLDDTSRSSYDSPSYSPEDLRGSTDISAYRTGSGKRIIGLAAYIEDFDADLTRGTFGATPTYVVAVLYDEFDSTDLNYLDQAKDTIETVESSRLRQNIVTPGALDGQGSSAYTLFVMVQTEEDAHELIEQLVVRPRI